MTEVRPGLYEHLVTERLNQGLAGTTPDLIQLGGLDPADAHETLTRHITRLASRALRAAGGSDAAAITRQVELTNRMIAAIGAMAPDASDMDDAVANPGRNLLAIAPPSAVPGPPAFPERPAVPMSTSALLV